MKNNQKQLNNKTYEKQKLMKQILLVIGLVLLGSFAAVAQNRPVSGVVMDTENKVISSATIKVKGKGAHGSAPWNGIDPIMISAQIINGLQTIVSRSEDLTKAPVVITVGKFIGGVRENIIPEEVTFSGTIRTLDAAMQKDVFDKIRRTASNIAEALGGTAEVTIDNKTLVTYNTPELVSMMIPSLQTAAGKENTSESTWTTGAEDFSFFGEKAPAFFFNLGGMPKGAQPTGHHTPDFVIDDSMLDVGVKAFCNLVFDYSRLKK